MRDTFTADTSGQNVRHTATQAENPDALTRDWEIRHLHDRVGGLLQTYRARLSTRQVARALIDATGELNYSDLSELTGYSRPTVRRAVTALARRWFIEIGSEKVPIAQIREPEHRGRGYGAKITSPAKALMMRDSARSGTHTQTRPEPDTSRSESIQDLGHRGGNASTPSHQRERKISDQTPHRVHVGRAMELYPNSTLVRGSRWWREAGAKLRRMLHQRGAHRESSDIIVSTILRRSAGRPLDELRQLGAALDEHAELVIRRVSAAPDRVTAFRRCNGILDRAIAGSDVVDDRGFDLTTEAGRLAFADRAREIADGGGGSCPRCNSIISPELIESPWLPWHPYAENDGLCTCVHVTVQRHVGGKREPSKRPPWIGSSWGFNGAGAASEDVIYSAPDRRRYDFSVAADRREFVEIAGQVAEDGGGPCPICGRRITWALWRDAGICHDDERLCRCISAARLAAAEAREAAHERRKQRQNDPSREVYRQLEAQLAGAPASNENAKVDPEAEREGFMRMLTDSQRRMVQNLRGFVEAGDHEGADHLRARLRPTGLTDEVLEWLVE